MIDQDIVKLGLNTRLALAAKEIGPIAKDEQNREQRFNFRSIETITGRVRAVFAKYGINVRPYRVEHVESEEVQSAKGSRGFRTLVHMTYMVGCDVLTDNGWLSVNEQLACVGEAIDYGDKSTSKAVQMAYKYALTEALSIGDSDADADSESHELAAPEQAPEQMRPAQRLATELAKLAEGDTDRAREWAVAGAKALGFVGKWAEDDDNVDRVLAWAKQTASTGFTPTEDAGEDIEEEQWSELFELLDSDPTVGTMEKIEQRVRRLHALMRARGVWLDGDGTDPLHVHLMEWYGAEHFSDLRVKANYKGFAEKTWEKAREDAVQPGVGAGT